MSIANLVVLLGFYYVSFLFYTFIGVMDNYAQSKEKGVKRGQYERATGAPDLVI
jgi:hypothetical protein